MRDVPDLSLCLVSWNCWEDLRACLLSLRSAGAGAREVLVVDNASRDGTPARLAAEFPDVRLLANAENRGFAAGCNQGLALATGRYLMLLNPDTLVPPDGLDELLAFADAHPEAGILGPQLRYPDGRLQHSCRRFPTIAAALFRHTFLGSLFPHTRSLADYLMDDWDHSTPREVDWVSGAALLIRRELYEELGPLDEGFFWGSEDVDYCWRAHHAGRSVLYTPRPRIVHAVGRSSNHAVFRTIVRTHRSMYRLYSKHLARTVAQRALVWVGVQLRMGLLLSRAALVLALTALRRR